MNEQTAKLIEQLAQKLGTTTEYLWSVLLKQAPIDATTSLFQIILVVLFGVTLFKIHKKLSVEVKETETTRRYTQTGYDKHELAAIIPMVIALIIFIVLLVASFFLINDIVNGFFNPEYWALERILHKVQ